MVVGTPRLMLLQTGTWPKPYNTLNIQTLSHEAGRMATDDHCLSVIQDVMFTSSDWLTDSFLVSPSFDATLSHLGV